jgi:hypothetical protein
MPVVKIGTPVPVAGSISDPRPTKKEKPAQVLTEVVNTCAGSLVAGPPALGVPRV